MEPRTATQEKNKYDLFSDIIIGMSDGLVIPFALVAGLSAIVLSSSVIALAALVATVAGAIAMSIGGYRAAKSATAYHQHDTGTKEEEAAKEKKFLANIGLNEEMQQRALEEKKKDQQLWTAFVANYEKGHHASSESAARSAFAIGLSYAAGGLVSVIPYFFMASPFGALKITAIATLACLFIFGYLKSNLMGSQPWWGALRAVLSGAFAAAAAFGAAYLVK